jgi:hypothetical protein
MSSDQLREAYRLIREGKKKEAAAILVPIVRAESANADAWWLLANALTEPDKQRRALEQVLRLRPDDDRAQRMMARLIMPPAESFPATSELPSSQPASEPSSDLRTLIESSPPSKRSRTASDDPFELVDDTGDPFKDVGDYDDPFAEVPSTSRRGSGGVIVTQPRSGTNPLLIILAIIGVLAVASCGICLAVTGGLAGALATFGVQFGQEVQNVLLTVTADPNFQLSSASQVLDASNLQMRGALEYGQSRIGTVDSFDDDGWTFSGEGGDRITIDLEERDGQLDPQLMLYGPDNRLVISNDDVDMTAGNMNSRVEITLPSTGTYTIVVSAFGTGGDYELTLKQN